jgi:1-phosphofructokinase
MIVTLTTNPSIDRTIEVDALHRGAVLRAHDGRVDPGGKGINVARALVTHGLKVRAVLPTGGAEGRQLAELLAGLGVDLRTVAINGAVRSNITVVEADGTVTKLNEPGPALDAGEIARLFDATLDASDGADWLVLSGSLPPGAGDETYATLLWRTRGSGVRRALDTSGPAFRLALAAEPDLVKPNREELAEATGRPVDTIGDAVTAARELLAKGAGAVLTSLGPDGALLVDLHGVVHAEAPPEQPRSTVGAGDALLAGFLSAGGAGPDALVTGVAWSAAAVRLPGSKMPSPTDLDPDAVRLHDNPDTNRPLTGAAR